MLRAVADTSSETRRLQPEHERLVEELAALPESERRAIVQEADEKSRRGARVVASWDTIDRMTGLVSLGGDSVEDCRRVYDR